jgi:uncharacterized protein (DUF3084 family)
MSLAERLDRLEASHVQLMTDHEVFMKEHEAFVAQNEREWARHKEWLRDYDERCERDRQDRKELDKRISDLVSAIGEFLRRG